MPHIYMYKVVEKTMLLQWCCAAGWLFHVICPNLEMVRPQLPSAFGWFLDGLKPRTATDEPISLGRRRKPPWTQFVVGDPHLN